MKYLKDNRRSLAGQTVAAQPQTQTVQQKIVTTPQKVQTTAQEPATALQTQSTGQSSAEQHSQTQATGQSSAATQAAQATQTAASSAAEQAQQLLSQQDGAYTSRWGSSIDDVLAQLLGQEEFTYDVNSDPLYLQLRDQYTRDGKLAMEDAMGQAAQLTGGYSNSYAQMLGQQTYQGYMQGLSEMIPDLKQAARDEYDARNDALLQRLSLLMEQDSQDYSRWMDELERQRYEEELAYSRERDALSDQRYDQEWAYQQDRDALSDQRYDQEWAYQQEQDALSNERYNSETAYDRQQDAYDRLVEMIISTGYQPTAEELEAAGMTESQARAWLGYYAATQGGSSGSSSGSSGSSSGSSGSSGSSSGSSGSSDGSSGSSGGSNVQTREELGDPLKKDDYVTVSANCAVFAGNGATASEISAYLKEALNEGSITEEQYKALMAKYGNLADSGNNGNSGGNSGSSGGGRGSGGDNRYNTFN